MDKCVKADDKEEKNVTKRRYAISFILSFFMVLQIFLNNEMVVDAEVDAEKDITVSVKKELRNEPLQINVPAINGGEYTVDLVYQAVDEKITAVQAGISVNDNEMTEIQLQKYYIRPLLRSSRRHRAA